MAYIKPDPLTESEPEGLRRPEPKRPSVSLCLCQAVGQLLVLALYTVDYSLAWQPYRHEQGSCLYKVD